MADVRPFKGLRYDPLVAGDPSRIICPPFDTIPPELQRTLYQQSSYNAVRLEAGERLPSDTAEDNRYTRSCAQLKDWIARGVLARDEEPAFYLVQHSFDIHGAERTRLELMACVRLEEYERRAVLPHEYTRDEDKRDRLALIEACHANFSPIMCLYRDGSGTVSAVLHRAMAGVPLLQFSDLGQQGYRVWKVDDLAETAQIHRAMSSGPLYIADGHHRYETALAYRDLRTSGHAGTLSPHEASDEAFNFVMMGLIGFDDPGLMVLPYHRVLGGLDDVELNRVREGLERLFDIAPFSPGDQRDFEAFLQEIELRGRDRLVLGLLDPQAGTPQLLTLKTGIDPASWGPIAGSEAWVLEEQVLKPVLGASMLRCLSYVHDGGDAESRVRSGEHQMGFFLKRFPLDLFETIMNLGQRLPPKSTFFYPKLPTGLVMNLLEGSL